MPPGAADKAEMAPMQPQQSANIGTNTYGCQATASLEFTTFELALKLERFHLRNKPHMTPADTPDIEATPDSSPSEATLLHSYIRNAYNSFSEEPAIRSSDSVFRDDAEVLLTPGRTNRIIVYAGCFNPPHHGHMQLLTHCLTAAQHSLNAIAAVVVPMDTEILRNKVNYQQRKARGPQNALVLAKWQRANLWANNKWWPDCAWVFPSSDQPNDNIGQMWLKFRNRLITILNADGFDIEFLVAGGVERSLTKEGSASRGRGWGTTSTIFSDVSRGSKTTLFGRNGELLKLKNCGDWEVVGRPTIDKSK
jgi:hypothetical protein